VEEEGGGLEVGVAPVAPVEFPLEN